MTEEKVVYDKITGESIGVTSDFPQTGASVPPVGGGSTAPSDQPGATAGVTASATTSGSTGIFNPQPNVLDLVDNVSYHLKLFMLPQSESMSEAINVRSPNAIILAESGVSSKLNIESATIRSVVGTSKTYKSMTSLEVNLEIREYMGAGFMDSIYAASLDLGIDSYYKCPYFLELTFVGRDKKSSIPLPNGETTRWVYPLVILSIESTVDSGGALYSVKTVAWTHQAGLKEAINIPQQISIDADTLDKSMGQLTAQINKILVERRVSDQSIPDEVEIRLDSLFAPMKLIPPEDTNTASARTEATSTKPGNRVISIPANTDLNGAIDTLIASTIDYQKMAKASDDKRSATISEDYKNGAPRVMHRIHVSTIQKAFDKTSGRYAKKYIYAVIPYKSVTNLLDPTDVTVSSEGRLKNMIASKTLNKEYNYIFTGQNDQIIDFNMKFNFAWYANVPVQGGAMTHQTSKNDGKVQSTADQEYIKRKDNTAGSAKNLPNIPANSIPSDSEENKYKDGLADKEKPKQGINTEVIERGKERARSGLYKAVPKAVRPRISEETKEAAEAQDKHGEANSTAPNNSGSDKKFTNESNVDTARDEVSLSGRQNPIAYLPTFTYENPSDGSINQNRFIEGYGGTGRQYMNSLFKSAFSAASGDLLKIKMTIKGDPYWLEPPISGTTYNFNRSPDPNDYLPTDSYANTVAFENYFILRVRTPEVPNVKTGLVITRPTTIDGVYGVLEVTHSFANGLFTQEVNAVLDPITNIEALSELKSAVKESENIADASAKTAPKAPNKLLGSIDKALGKLTDLEKKARGEVKKLEDKVTGVVDKVEDAVVGLAAKASDKVNSASENLIKSIKSRGK